MKKTLFFLLTAAFLLGALCSCQTAPAAQSAASLAPAPGSTENPPLIPHEVEASDTGEVCLGCHREGEMDAPKTPHPWLVDCLQCHIAQEQGAAPFKVSY